MYAVRNGLLKPFVYLLGSLVTIEIRNETLKALFHM